MIHIHPLLDVYILANGHIQLRSLDFSNGNVCVSVIRDENTALLARTFTSVKAQGQLRGEWEEMCRNGAADANGKLIISTLLDRGILTRETVAESAFSHPWACHPAGENLYWLRVDHTLYAFRAQSKQDAERTGSVLMRRHDQSHDLAIHQSLQNGRLTVLGATALNHAWVSAELNTARRKMDGLPLAEFIISNDFDTLKLEPQSAVSDASRLLNGSDNGWQRIIEQATRHPGLISRIEKIEDVGPAFQHNQAMYRARHILSDVRWLTAHSQFGLDNQDEAACGKAIMESYERYCCGAKLADIVAADTESLPVDQRIDPGSLANYLPRQTRLNSALKNAKPREPYDWTTVRDYHGRKLFVPACFCSYRYLFSDYTDGRSLFWANTSGVAAHLSFDKAALAAVRELIERDAIMLWWLNRVPPPRLSPDVLDTRHRQLMTRIESCGYEAALLELTLDLLPVFLCVARKREASWPNFLCSAACHENTDVAIGKAMEQVALTTAIGRSPEPEQIRAQTVSSPSDHRSYYLDPKNGPHLDFLFSGTMTEEKPRDVAHRDLADLCALLQKKGFPALFKDLTCAELVQENPEVRVVRALIPGLVPMTFGYMREPLALPRIRELFFARGMRSHPVNPEALLNQYQVHFFA